ncbi:MAG TPA: hypothetical protein VFB45_15410 [Pseudolabrys sp.]|nr:hypothetical protein [Pseudolabrys sp.]
MPIFFHNVVLPDDPNGFGIWLIEHYREHLQFVQIGLNLTPPTFIPDYALQSWSDKPAQQTAWLNSHQEIHNTLRNLTGVSGIDLSVVDLDNAASWLLWMDAHAAEHVALEQVLGVP